MSSDKWKKENTISFGLRLYKTIDADILAVLKKQSSKQEFAKAAIRYYIANGCPEINRKETDDE